MTAPHAVGPPDEKHPAPGKPPRFEVFEQIAPRGVFRWRLVTAGGDAAIVSHAAFRHPADARADATKVQEAAAVASVVDKLGPAGGMGR